MAHTDEAVTVPGGPRTGDGRRAGAAACLAHEAPTAGHLAATVDAERAGALPPHDDGPCVGPRGARARDGERTLAAVVQAEQAAQAGHGSAIVDVHCSRACAPDDQVHIHAPLCASAADLDHAGRPRVVAHIGDSVHYLRTCSNEQVPRLSIAHADKQRTAAQAPWRCRLSQDLGRGLAPARAGPHRALCFDGLRVDSRTTHRHQCRSQGHRAHGLGTSACRVALRAALAAPTRAFAHHLPQAGGLVEHHAVDLVHCCLRQT
ncbi:hypothetical protein D3C87_920730 [compost metagenome]